MNESSGWELVYRRGPTEGREVPHEYTDSLHARFQEHSVQKILDLGCGDGRHLMYFGNLGYEMYGLDHSSSAIQLAEQWLTEEKLSAEFVCTGMDMIPWSNEYFDAVICFQAINHNLVDAIRRTIAEIHRVLRKEGWLFVTIGTWRLPDSFTFHSGTEVEPNTIILTEGHEKGVPHHFFTTEEILREFSQFNIVNLDHDSRNRACLLAQK